MGKMTDQIARPNRRTGFWFWLASAAVVVAAGWSGLWFIAAHMTEGAIEMWVADERSMARDWSCREQSVSGFPFRIQFKCKNPTMAATWDGRRIFGSLNDAVATASVADPQLIVADFASPLELVSGDMVLARATWRSAGLEVKNASEAVERLSATLAEPEFSIAGNNGNLFAMKAHVLKGQLARIDNVAGAGDAFELEANLSGVLSQYLDNLSGETSAADMQIKAKILKADALEATSLAHALELWRAAGGSIEILKATFSKANMSFEARGVLALDAAHRLSGNLDVEANGIAPLLRKLGFPASAFEIQGLLDKLAPGRAATAETSLRKPLRIQLALKGGRLFVGLLPTPIIFAPLY